MRPVLALCTAAAAAVVVAGACAGAVRPPAEPMVSPEVIVLIFSGTEPFEQVSINYAAAIPHEQAAGDIEVLTREFRWVVRKQSVSTRSADVPGAKPSTSSVMETTPIVNRREGLLPLEPFIVALKRFRSIEIDYLIVGQFRFRGLKEFANDSVKIQLAASENAYRYRIAVRNSDFKRLNLPLGPAARRVVRKRGMPHGAWVVLVLGLAIVAAAGAYLAASRLWKGRNNGA